MACSPQQIICNWKEKITCYKLAHYDYLPINSFMITQFQYQNLQFPSCSKQFSFFSDCFIAHTLCPINKHLLSHDSDKWKPPLHPYEIVYPQKLLTWRYEKLGCPGIYHILLVQCHLEVVKRLRHPLHFCPSAFSRCLHQEATYSSSPTHNHKLMHIYTA